jgi:hypothetical protein
VFTISRRFRNARWSWRDEASVTGGSVTGRVR